MYDHLTTSQHSGLVSIHWWLQLEIATMRLHPLPVPHFRYEKWT